MILHITCIIKEVPRNDCFIWVSNVMSCDLSGVGRPGSALVMMCDPGYVRDPAPTFDHH